MLNSELTIITDMHSYAIHKELTKATRNIMKANDTTNALCRSRLVDSSIIGIPQLPQPSEMDDETKVKKTF